MYHCQQRGIIVHRHGLFLVSFISLISLLRAISEWSPISSFDINSYTLHTLHTICSQSDVTIPKIRESDKCALFLYNREFQVASYQGNFASHHTTAMLVSSSHGMVLQNTTKCSVSFYLVHYHIPYITLSNYNWVTRISEYILGRNCKSLHEVKSSSVFVVFFSIPRYTKRKPRDVAKLCAYRCVPRRANSLLHST